MAPRGFRKEHNYESPLIALAVAALTAFSITGASAQSMMHHSMMMNHKVMHKM